MEITVNGKRREVPAPLTVEAVLRILELPAPESGVAVALNGELVRRGEWGEKLVQADDELEIVQATQGG